MATTKLQNYVFKLADGIAKAFQLDRTILGNGSDIGSPTTVSGVHARQAIRGKDPTNATYGVADLNTEIDVDHLISMLSVIGQDGVKRDLQDPLLWSLSSSSGHPSTMRFNRVIAALKQYLLQVRNADNSASSYDWSQIANVGATNFADRLFLAPEFAYILRSMGERIPGSAVRGPNWTVGGIAQNLATLTLPATINDAVTAIKHGTDSAVFAEGPLAPLTGPGYDKDFVGLQLEIVNVSGGSIVLGATAPELTLYYRNEAGAEASMVFTLSTGTWTNGSAKDGPTVNTNAKIFSAWRVNSSGNAGVIDPKNESNGNALEGKTLAIRFKDVAVTA